MYHDMHAYAMAQPQAPSVTTVTPLVHPVLGDTQHSRLRPSHSVHVSIGHWCQIYPRDTRIRRTILTHLHRHRAAARTPKAPGRIADCVAHIHRHRTLLLVLAPSCLIVIRILSTVGRPSGLL